MYNDLRAIEAVTWTYLNGLYEGDAAKLEHAFHPTSALTTAQDDGTADFETLRLALSGVELDYKGKAGNVRTQGRLQAVLPDLARLSGLAGRPLGGRAEIAAEAAGAAPA